VTEVHLHVARPDELRDEPLLARLSAMLSPGELARNERFKTPELRRDALITRALVRTTLSLHVDVPPEAWTFREGPHGRPEIANPPTEIDLRFNVSHTRGLIVCAVARSREIGVDVERIDAAVEPLALAQQFFSELEIAPLRSLEGDALREWFFAVWTLKEAYAKARGLGLHLPLDRFGFTFADDGVCALHVDDTIADDPTSWSFWRRALGPHRLALAMRKLDGATPDVKVIEQRW